MEDIGVYHDKTRHGRLIAGNNKPIAEVDNLRHAWEEMAAGELTPDGGEMGNPVVTAVDTRVDPTREAELIEGFRVLNEGERPEGLLCSELLRGRDGAFRVQSIWRDLDAVIALRATGARPAVLDLLDRLGLEHTHAVFTVEQRYGDR